MKLYVGIRSAAGGAHRRDACRRSWMPAAAAAGAEVAFAVLDRAVADPTRGGETIHHPWYDDVSAASVVALAAWARAGDADRLFLCDDATFAHAARLWAAAREAGDADFVGYEQSPGVPGGGGCLLSRRAVAVASALAAPAPRGGAARGGDLAPLAFALDAAGIDLRHDRRFRPWPDRLPTPWDDQVSAGGVDAELMVPLARSLASPCRPPFRIVDAQSAWGAVGVNGHRGFVVDGRATVDVPAGHDLAAGHLVSAHATSRVTLEVEDAAGVEVRGYLDAGARGHRGPVLFVADGQHLGTVAEPCDPTPTVQLTPGRHILETVATGDRTRRYAVWQLLPREA